jgi:phosphoribosylamine---glycine ligase
LQHTSWASLFRSLLTCSTLKFRAKPGFAVGIVITTPPFPYYRDVVPEPIGLPVLFDGELLPEERRHIHYGEVGLTGTTLVTTGMSGYTLVVTGTGPTIGIARDAANKLAAKIIAPNGRYRRDIGTRLIEGDFARVESLGNLRSCRAAPISARLSKLVPSLLMDRDPNWRCKAKLGVRLSRAIRE